MNFSKQPRYLPLPWVPVLIGAVLGAVLFRVAMGHWQWFGSFAVLAITVIVNKAWGDA